MERVVLNKIPFSVDVPQLLKMVHLDEGCEDAATVHSMALEAEAIARPKAIYKVSFLDDKTDASVSIEGVSFASRVMRVNLDVANRVFAFVATCGAELQAWADGREDILESYWADAIMMQGVGVASRYLAQHLQERFSPGPLSRMNPGSLADWPLRQQEPLFRLIGDVEESIGVQLTDSYLMIPRKSVSGIQFPTQESFESCQLCDRQMCPGRRAPYDASLFEHKYQQTVS